MKHYSPSPDCAAHRCLHSAANWRGLSGACLAQVEIIHLRAKVACTGRNRGALRSTAVNCLAYKGVAVRPRCWCSNRCH
jgi:hypothetical protein